MNNKWIVVKTQTEINGAIEDSPDISIKVFDKSVNAVDCMRKWFCDACNDMVGTLCFAKLNEGGMNAKVCGECTVVTIGIKSGTF